MKTFVIAGNSEQARQWIREHIAKRQQRGETTLSLSEYVTVDGADKLRGTRDPHGVFIGTWIDRTDLDPIFQQLLTATDITQNSHRVINQMWGRWKDNKKPIMGEFRYDDTDDTMKVFDGTRWITSIKDYLKDD